jgi:Asparagine synthase
MLVKSFFLVASKSGRAIPQGELDRFHAIIHRSINFAGSIRSTVSCRSARGNVYLVALTNEPETSPMLEHDDIVFAVSGDCCDIAGLRGLRPTPRLALHLSAITGRFSTVVMDTRSGAVAVGNSAVRIDSIFVGQSRDFHFIGTQASVVCRLLHGEYHYDIDALYTLIGTGFFGTDATSFRGVSVLPPLTTWALDGDRATEHTTHLGDVKSAAGPFDELVDTCLDAYLDAVKPLVRAQQPVTLALSGGKDSRLVLSALRHAGIDVRCYTVDRGADNAADVYVATELARLMGVRHEVKPGDGIESRGEQSALRVDLLERTAMALRASDGSVFGYDRAYFRTDYSTQIHLTGHGGEVMRGGYAEHHRLLLPGAALRIARRIFCPAPGLYTGAANRQYLESLTRWVKDHASRMPPEDVLDCLYVYFRCGRWVAGTSRGTTTSASRLFPCLDNRLALAMVRAPAAHKVQDRLIRGILRRLDPVAADFPLAGQHWHDAGPDERRRMEEVHRAAFARAAGRANLDWRLHIAPPIMEHVRRYCLEEGRVDLLSPILDLGAVKRFLHSQEAALPARRRVLFGLYAACVLVCGDWLRTPLPSAPVQVRAGATE